MEMLALHGLLVRAREWSAALLPWVRPAAALSASAGFSVGGGDIDPGKPIVMAGLQRSGTNYLETVLASLYGPERLQNNFWKHAFASELAPGHLDGSVLVLLSRHPVMWLNSCLEHYPADLMDKRFAFFEGKSREAGYADLYNKFYGEWLATVEATGGVWARYEDLLRGDLGVLKRLGGPVDPTGGLADAFQANPDRVPQSLRFSEEDRKRALRMECTIPEQTAKAFWDALDPGLVKRIGYRFDEVRFTDELGVRTIAYRLLHRPQDVSEADIDGLIEVAKTQFERDSAVLHAIGKRLARRGRCGEALDWHAAALAACDQEDADFGHKSTGQFFRFEIAEEVLASFGRGEIAPGEGGARDPAFWEQAFQTAAAASEECLRRMFDVEKAHGSPAVLLVPYLLQLSDIQSRAGRGDAALASARQALELAPDSAAAHGHLAALLMRGDDLGADTEAALRRALALDPANAQQHFNLAVLLERHGRNEEALAEYEKATTGEGAQPWYHHQRGQLLAKCGFREEGAASLAEAIRAEPDIAIHHYVLSEIRKGQGRFEEAAESLKAAVACDPADGRLKFALAALLEQLNRSEEALPYFEAAAASAAAVPWFFHRMAVVQARLERFEAAETSLEEAIRREPDNMIHHFVQHDVRRRRGRLDAAEASLREAMRCEPANGRLMFDMSDLLFQMGRRDEALAHLQAATATPETGPWIFHRCGVELAREHRFDEAEANLREAIRREPESVKHYYALHEVLLAHSRPDDAAAILREALRVAPEDEGVRKALRKLDG